MSWDTIVIVAGAYAFMLVLILSLLTASKRGDQAAQRAVAEDRARQRQNEEDRRDVA